MVARSPTARFHPSVGSDALRNWTEIGEYLSDPSIQLLPPDHRATLRENWQDITHQEEHLEDAILIGLVGGTGVGKSTFINALAGQEVSRSSDRRPTTDRVIVYRHVNTEIPADVPTEDFAQPEVLHDNDGIEKVVLFDFPDFDSAEDAHTQIIRRYLNHLDVLLVVVDDIKYADRRLYELLVTLDHDPTNLFVLLNKTDRLRARYGDQVESVVDDLVTDLDQKLRENSRLHLKSGQILPVAALEVYQARVRDEPSPAFERFQRVERILEGFQTAKHRRAAKERNIDSRKRDLMETLVTTALGDENASVLSDAKSLVHTWRTELDKALRSVPVGILTESERDGVRGARLRTVSPGWGLPFSLLFTLLGEIRRRRNRGSEPLDLQHRVVQHYRGFFESVKNIRSRFVSEFAGTRIHLATLNELESKEVLRVSPADLSGELHAAIENLPSTVSMGRRSLAHVPAVGSLVLALWGKIYDVLDGENGILATLFETLNPTFIVGTILGVLLVYALTAAMIWLREVQKLDHAVSTAEQATRELVRGCGQDAVDQLDQDVKRLYDEFERLNQLIS